MPSDTTRGGKNRRDLLLIGGCLLLAALLFFFFKLTGGEGAGVIVRVNGEETARYSLYDNGVYPLNGGTNTMVIENGEAWISHANCPDSLCVKQGRVHTNGQVITCLPNRLTVTVYGGKESEVDIIS